MCPPFTPEGGGTWGAHFLKQKRRKWKNEKKETKNERKEEIRGENFVTNIRWKGLFFHQIKEKISAFWINLSKKFYFHLEAVLKNLRRGLI